MGNRVRVTGEAQTSSLVDILAPRPGSTVLICDVHASESGALSILTDLYRQLRAYEDKTVTWVMVVSTPQFQSTDNIKVERYPWVKNSWGHRSFFDHVTIRSVLKRHRPEQVLSLQNGAIPFDGGRQTVYLHQALYVTDYPFSILKDGARLWFYKNVISRLALRSLEKADGIIVQTRWMKERLLAKTGVEPKRIQILPPDISCNSIGRYRDTTEHRRRLFYPAIGVSYKNHETLLKALKLAQDSGLGDYELILTIRPDENPHTRKLADYARQNGLSVIFGGQIPRERVFELYAKSILVFPSCIESFGLPLLEARMTGSPVIAADFSFSREILSGYERAVFFREKDAEELSRLLLREMTSL